MELIERGDHHLEVRDDGTWKKHYSKFLPQGGGLIRVDKDPVTKREVISRFKSKALVTADKTTGEIKQRQDGFIVEHELIGPGKHPDVNLEYVMAYLPEDFQKKVSVDLIEIDSAGVETKKGKITEKRTAYKVNPATKKLVKLSQAKLMEPVKRNV